MDYKILMPQLSDSMEEGKLISWKVKPGDRVQIGESIAEVESDKAIMEVQSFKKGVVKELKLSEGQSAPVGSVIAVIDTQAQSGGESPSGQATPREEPSAPEPVQPHDTSIPGGAPSAPSPSPDTSRHESAKPRAAEEGEPIQPSSSAAQEAQPSIVEELFSSQKSSGGSEAGSSLPAGQACPRTRAKAAKYGLDLEELQRRGALPTPAHEEDIRRYVQRRYFTSKAWSLAQSYRLNADSFSLDHKIDEPEVRRYIEEHEIPLPEPLSAMRKAIIATVEAAAKKPSYRIYDRIDATLILQYESARHTVSVWLLKLLAEAMMRHEALRSTLSADSLEVWPNASIALAMAKGEALYMPVFRDLNRKNVDEIADELTRYKAKLEQGAFASEDLQGSTFALSNLGMTGIERFDAMIHASDSGIAAVGAAIEGHIGVTLTLDHRLVNGWQGAEFIRTLKDLAKDRTFFSNAKGVS